MIYLPPTITSRTKPEIATFVIDTIKAAGIRVSPSSRLGRMHKLFYSGRKTIEPGDPDFELALEAERDLQLLAFAFDQLKDMSLSPRYLEKLRYLVKDSLLPQNDHKRNSKGRDFAFEILVCAICAAAQLKPVEWEEPDITCSLGGKKYGVAAKRLKNTRNLYDRVDEAVGQIVGSGIPGMIVLDMGLAFNPKNHRLKSMSDSILHSEYQRHFHATWHRHQARVQRSMNADHILGIVVHDYHVRQQSDDWQLTGMTIRVPAAARARAQQREFETLSTLYVHGLPNQSEHRNDSLILI